MKKALAILMVLALVASAVTAEVSIGAWGRGIFAPLANSGDDSYTDTAPSWGGWGGDEARIGFTIAGNSDNVGFQIDGNVDGGAFSMGDQQKIWVKPMDMLKFQMGRIYDDTLRGNAAFGSFNWYRGFGSGDGEDITFSRVGIEGSREGFEVAISPMDALYIAVYFHSLDKNLTENMFKNMQAAFGYKIEGIGQIKAQYFAKQASVEMEDEEGETITVLSDDADGRIEVAFNLTKVENLFVEFGFRMPTDTDIAGEWQQINVYGNYKMDAMTFHLLAMITLTEDDTVMKFGAGMDYALDGGIGINADVRYYNDVAYNGEDARITFMVGATKGFSNGLIGAGLEVVSADETGYMVPVRMEYWF
ncbi:MAG: hypothetical protein JW875_05835 [Spirochaetales bacterium]|nr:hypothetical protein [Spirochaetales bacterium]